MTPANRRAVLVTGSRAWDDHVLLSDALDEVDPQLVLHGGCEGADSHAERWAKERNCSTWRLQGPWAMWGKAAGPKRNGYLVANARALARQGVDVVVLAFPMPNSRGTWDCVRKAQAAGLTVRVIRG